MPASTVETVKATTNSLCQTDYCSDSGCCMSTSGHPRAICVDKLAARSSAASPKPFTSSYSSRVPRFYSSQPSMIMAASSVAPIELRIR